MLQVSTPQMIQRSLGQRHAQSPRCQTFGCRKYVSCTKNLRGRAGRWHVPNQGSMLYAVTLTLTQAEKQASLKWLHECKAIYTAVRVVSIG